MNSDIQKSWDWDRQYQRLISDIQKHFPKFDLIWDAPNNIWAMSIGNGTAVGIGNRVDYKDVDLTDLDEFVDAQQKLIAAIITYGGTNGY